jgi:hypothetical protein
MILIEVMVNKCADRVLHLLFASSANLSASKSANHCLSIVSCCCFNINYYLEELLQTSISCFLNVGFYRHTVKRNWVVSTRVP